MSEPANDPPMVTRPPEVAPPVPKRPRPGFWEALVWCLLFLAGQVFGAVAGMGVVFIAYALAEPEPVRFMLDQLEGFSKASDAKAQDDRPPVPFEIGRAVAWGMLSAQFVSLGMIALVLPRRIGPDWKRQLGVRRPSGLHVLLVLMIVPGFVLFADVIQTVFVWATDLKPPATMRALNGIFRQFPWPLTVLAVALGPGVVEEFWFRGFLGRGLSARYGLGAGVLLTSLFFAVAHLDPSQLLTFALMGAYLHFVYRATRSIWPSILLHAMNNGIAVLLLLVLPPEKLEQPTPVIVPLASLSLLIFGSVALWTNRARVERIAADDPTRWDGWESDEGTWKAEYPGISTPAPESGLRLGYGAVSPVALGFTFASFSVLLYLCYRYVI
ncbi:CPBP family intramembrane glutamic endopeptidase [Frigoriglobus tundricola]|uniref:CAAX prenyl protease 2/Lysostaphin resistance protein A-like domain-containing protein n=1 Tax=Frigoriglobus tundricola TaxID=2774151 RepID=A0A6M5Z1N9_9BACT|nr:type II CAAX endopeptidase family protein [Frigoriglobus tundricola]QJW99341.1 hypothetical protein FTUN_6949 [Frigoriglobus tundricola]